MPTRTKPAAAAPVAEKVAPAAVEVKGTSWLAEHVNSEAGTEYDGYGIRILLRQLIKDGVIERGEGRYSFSGPKYKTVVAVVKAVKSGAADKAKQARLDALKEKGAAKKAAAAPEPVAKRTRARKTTAKAAEAETADDADLDIDDI